MKLVNPYLYTAAQPHSRTAAQPHSRTAAQPHSRNSGLNAKKNRNASLLGTQLRNLTLAVPHFSFKTNLLYPQEGHLLRQIALTTQRGPCQRGAQLIGCANETGNTYALNEIMAVAEKPIIE